MRSITEEQCYAPAINLTAFPAVSLYAAFWSSSPFAADGSFAWFAYLYDGDSLWAAKATANQVRLVRGGQ